MILIPENIEIHKNPEMHHQWNAQQSEFCSERQQSTWQGTGLCYSHNKPHKHVLCTTNPGPPSHPLHTTLELYPLNKARVWLQSHREYSPLNPFPNPLTGCRQKERRSFPPKKILNPSWRKTDFFKDNFLLPRLLIFRIRFAIPRGTSSPRARIHVAKGGNEA